MRAKILQWLPQGVALAVMCALPLRAQTALPETDSLRLAAPAVAKTSLPAIKKNPTGAALRSLAIPGWGQYYNGQKIKAAIAMAAEVGEIGTAIYWNSQVNNTSDPDAKFVYRDYRNQALWFLAGTILLSMMDAYVDAHLAGFDEGPSLDAPNAVGSAPAAGFAIRFHIKL